MFAFFVLGRDQILSASEITAVYGNLLLNTPVVEHRLFIGEFDYVDVTAIAKRLGGSVKYGEIKRYPDVNGKHLVLALVKIILERIEQLKLDPKKKIIFSLSAPAGGLTAKTLGLAVKAELLRFGRSARLAVQREGEEMAAAAVAKARLLDRGVDLIVHFEPRKNSAWIGITQALQPFAEQSKRDFDRPARDMKRGLIPIQLARIMVNLALGIYFSTKNNRVITPTVLPESFTLLDPFCGQGTILMEAALIGIPHLFGSDLDYKAVHETKNNLAWFWRHERLAATFDDRVKLFVSDARKLENNLAVDMIVTEPYLGAIVHAPLTPSEIERRVHELRPLYTEALIAMARTIKKNGVIVMALPAFALRGEFLHFPIEGMLPSELVSVAPFGPFKDNFPLRYGRHGQYVGRELLLLRKV